MPTLDDVYRKFGYAAEAAQLLETELGNMLIKHGVLEEDLINQLDPNRAAELFRQIDKHTLGQLITKLKAKDQSIVNLEDMLGKALDERNRLFHSFYRQHNFRRNSDEGRQRMLDDLESVHKILLDAYKAVMLLSGVDLDNLSSSLSSAGSATLSLPADPQVIKPVLSQQVFLVFQYHFGMS